MIALLLVSALAACQVEPPAEAAQPPAAPDHATTDVGPDIVVEAPADAPDPIVCVMQTRTGSITRRRVCRPQSEIDREEADSDFRMRNMRRWGTIRGRRLGF